MQPTQGNLNIKFSSEEQQNLFNNDCIEFDKQFKYCQLLEKNLQNKDRFPTSFPTHMTSIRSSSSESDLNELNSAHEKLDEIRARILGKISNS